MTEEIRGGRIRVEKAAIGYRSRVLIRAVDLDLGPGDFLAIVGPNGSGKTTLLRTILGVIPPLSGRVRRAGLLGYAPQRQELDPIFPFSASEVVAMGLLRPRTDDEPEPNAGDCAAKVAQALEDCGIADQAEQAFRDLSGGQRQRALLARALVSDPDILVLDEPTNDLDLAGEHEVMELVSALNEAGRGVVIVSHMLHVVARHARTLALIHDGRIDQGAMETMLVPDRLERLYGIPVAVHELDRGRMVAPLRRSR